MVKEKVYCEDCKWKESTIYSPKCNSLNTFEQSGVERIGTKQYCSIINMNNNCEYFEKRKPFSLKFWK